MRRLVLIVVMTFLTTMLAEDSVPLFAAPYEDQITTATSDAEASVSDEQSSWEQSVVEMRSVSANADRNPFVAAKLKELQAEVYRSRHVDNWICLIYHSEEYGQQLKVWCNSENIQYVLYVNYTREVDDIISVRGKWIFFSGEVAVSGTNIQVNVNTSAYQWSNKSVNCCCAAYGRRFWSSCALLQRA